MELEKLQTALVYLLIVSELEVKHIWLLRKSKITEFRVAFTHAQKRARTYPLTGLKWDAGVRMLSTVESVEG